MDALILSCSTGGGHNAAALAIKDELESRGYHADFFDPYSLVGNGMEKKVGGCYVTIVQKAPHFFGVIYQLGDWYRYLPVHSPVYHFNKFMASAMGDFLAAHKYDVIFATHIYPGEILTYMKSKGYDIPKFIFVATDYVCIPFTEEAACDRYMTPSALLERDYMRHGIAKDKLCHTGIPVRRVFNGLPDRDIAAAKLGLDKDKRYLLMSGGSMGAGQISKSIAILLNYLAVHSECHLIVLCGNNRKLLDSLKKKYGNCKQLTLMPTTNKIAMYMKASYIFMSKPGGLSSTEAAVANVPLIHIAPIPGCENYNMKFFEEHGMSISVGERTNQLIPAIELLSNDRIRLKMIENQKKYINPRASSDICDIAEQIINAD